MPNSRVKLTVRLVTARACARSAPSRPAAYAERYTDKKMLRAAQCFVIAMSMVSTSMPTAVFADSAIEAARQHLQIESIADMSNAKPYGPPDVHFWDIVRLGKAALPDLLILVEDETPTPVRVELFGGIYRVGDIAVIAMMRICPNLPVVEFVDDPQQPRFENIGFGIYWAYVRASRGNRQALQARLREWFVENESRLQWVVNSEHPAGGWYAIAPAAEE